MLFTGLIHRCPVEVIPSLTFQEFPTTVTPISPANLHFFGIPKGLLMGCRSLFSCLEFS